MSLTDRFKSAWNAFNYEEKRVAEDPFQETGVWGYRPDRNRPLVTNERSIITSLYSQLAVDVANIPIRHIREDSEGRFSDTMKSALGYCMSVEANIDQSAYHFRQDLAMTIVDKGVAAVVPVDTTLNPIKTGGFDVLTMRVGEVVAWFPRHVEVNLYNDRNGQKQTVRLPKSFVAIIENPLYSVMNEPNSTLQRLIRKLSLLDAVDEQMSSGKLDLIIQLPYVIKTEARKDQAEKRRKDIEMQLAGSKYGIAYTDGTERITQLNRPAENNLLKQVEYLTQMLYNELGITKEVFDGTASESAMLNYHNKTVKPIVTAITEEFSRKFLTKTARSQGQKVSYNRDPFSLVPVNELAEIADKFTRNEILTSNEVRSIIGFKPVNDEKADQLSNKNLPEPSPEPEAPTDV